MTFNKDKDYTKVDDAEIDSLLSFGLKQEKDVSNANRSWIDFKKMEFARSARLRKFFMDEIPFIAVYYPEGMFVRIADNFAPCGYFRYETIRTHVS